VSKRITSTDAGIGIIVKHLLQEVKSITCEDVLGSDTLVERVWVLPVARQRYKQDMSTNY
jgi:hypothetical protein